MRKKIAIIALMSIGLSANGQWSGNDSKSENSGNVRRVATNKTSQSNTKFYYEINLTNTMAKVYGNTFETGAKDYFRNVNAINGTNIVVDDFDNFGFDQHLGWHFMSPNSRVGFQLGIGAGYGTSKGIVREIGLYEVELALDMGYLDMESNITYTFFNQEDKSVYGLGGFGLGFFHTFDETATIKNPYQVNDMDHVEYTSLYNLNFGIGADINGLSLKGTISVPMSSLDLTESGEASILDKEVFKDDLPTFFSIKLGYRI